MARVGPQCHRKRKKNQFAYILRPTDKKCADTGQRNVTKRQTPCEWKNCFVIFVVAFWNNGAFVCCHDDFSYNYKLSI